MKPNSDKEIASLVDALRKLKSKKEIRDFLTDLLSPSELTEFSKRWQATGMLNQGVSYVEIVSSTGLSSTTIARISKCLNGPVGGYRKALSKKEKKK